MHITISTFYQTENSENAFNNALPDNLIVKKPNN